MLIAGIVGSLAWMSIAAAPPECGSPGADLAITHIEGVRLTRPGDGRVVLDFGTRQTNFGDVPIAADLSTVHHPVQTFNLYKHTFDRGVSRFEQLASSWCYHAGRPLNMGGVCTCSGGAAHQIAPGCSDPHGPASTARLDARGPRFELDIATGWHRSPHTRATTEAAGRLVIAEAQARSAPGVSSDLVAEAIVVHIDEPFQNRANNISHRVFRPVAGETSATLIPIAVTKVGTPAIDAWPELADGVELERVADLAGGEYSIAARVVRVGGNRWHYEYGVANLTSASPVRAFAIPLSRRITVVAADARVPSHDGSETSTWSADLVSGDWLWHAPIDHGDAAATALQWGTLANFSICCNAAPAAGRVRLHTTNPESFESLQLHAALPVPGAASCLADHDGDGVQTVHDMLAFLSDWFAQNAGGDADGDGTTAVPDLFIFLGDWFSGC